MSVINQMLRDLDQRKPESTQQSQQQVYVQQNQTKSFDYIRYAVIGMAGIALIIATSLYLNNQKTQNLSSESNHVQSDGILESDKVFTAKEIKEQVVEPTSVIRNSEIINEEITNDETTDRAIAKNEIVNNDLINKSKSIVNNKQSIEPSSEQIKDTGQKQSAEQNLKNSKPETIQFTKTKTNGDQVVVAQTKSDQQGQSIPSNKELQTTEQKLVKSNPVFDIKTQILKLLVSAKKDIELDQMRSAISKLDEVLTLDENYHQARVLKYSLLINSKSRQLSATFVSQKDANLDSLSKSGSNLVSKTTFDKINSEHNSPLFIDLQNSVNRWPLVYEYRILLARFYSMNSDDQDALNLLQQDIPNIDMSIKSTLEYHALIAYLAQKLSVDQLAVKHYQLLLKNNSKQSQWWLGLALSSEKLGDRSSALRAYEQSISRPGLAPNVQQYVQNKLKQLRGY